MPFTTKDALIVAELLRNAARAEILPRFRNLAEGSIRQKTSVLDLVTDADEAAERAIEAKLLRAFPGALVIGEEAASRNPDLLRGLGEADLAFILDPVDGTLNFASGLPLFGVMAGVLRRGEVICGIILEPIVDGWAIAVRGRALGSNIPTGAPRGDAGMVQLDRVPYACNLVGGRLFITTTSPGSRAGASICSS